MYNLNIPILIPSYEPDCNLETLCKTLIKHNFSNIVIIDDGSGPKYKELFQTLETNYKCIILRHAVNLGKGRALKDAFNYCLNTYTNLIGVITADSDGQHTPFDIEQCIDALQLNPNNLILGCRNFNCDDIPWKSKYGNALTRKVCSFLCGVRISDTQTGLRGIPKEFMQYLMNVNGERFEFETNMLIESRNRNINITEIPISTVYDSKENHKTHFDPIVDSIKIYSILGKVFIKYIFSSLSSSILDLILFLILCKMLYIWNPILYVTIATFFARFVSATYNYTLNYKIVFKSRVKKTVSLSKYILLAVVQMSLSAMFVTLGVQWISFLSEINIKIIVDIVLFFISYKIQQTYIF